MRSSATSGVVANARETASSAAVKHWTEMAPRWHENYERGRPGYPPQVVGVPSVPPTASVLELAPGTGKLTRLLVSDFERVLAIEPDPEMRRLCAAACPQAKLIAATAEEIPLADCTVDAVFCAEAFHWFAHERALAGIARVLRPGGSLVLAWNRPAGGIDPPIAPVERLLEPYWPESIEMPLDLDPRQFPRARDWPLAFERSAFEPLHELRFENTQTVDRERLVAFFASMGWVGDLPDEERVHLLEKVRSLLVENEYRMLIATHVYWTRLTDPG